MGARLPVEGVAVLALLAAASAVAFSLVLVLEDVTRAYTEVVGNRIPNLAALERLLRESEKPVVVMFESEACPTCRRIMPYWARLEEASDELPVAFYHITYSPESASAFQRYGVAETPTFIVFVDGEPVARHVGDFPGDNVTQAILDWALAAAGLAVASDPERLASQGLSVYNSRCAACHGRIESLDPSSIRSWFEARRLVAGDLLAERLAEALEANATLSELYGGYGSLAQAVASMRRYVPDLSAYEVDRAAYLLEYASAVLLGREPPRIELGEALGLTSPGPGRSTPLNATGPAAAGVAGLVAAAAALVAGVATALSPCTFPVLVAHVAVLARGGRGLGPLSCAACGLAAAAAALGVGALFALAGPAVALAQELALPVLGSLVAGAGFAALLGVPMELPALVGRRPAGLGGFCAVYGLLALQCNLPMVAGALLLVAGSGALGAPLLAAAAFAAGAGGSLAASVYAISRLGDTVARRLVSRGPTLYRAGGLAMLVAGLTLLAYGLGLL